MTTDEIFENVQTLMVEPETEEDYLNIDWNTREITIPKAVPNLGVYNDKDTNRLYFRCPVQYGEFSVADFGIRINYKNGSADGDVYLVEDATVSDGYLTFTWLVGRNAYLLQSSTTQFSVCCKIIDGDGNVVNELNTTIASLKVLQGLETGETFAASYPDLLEQYMEIAETAEKTAQEAKDTADESLKKITEVEESIPTKVSKLENDVPYVTRAELELYLEKILGILTLSKWVAIVEEILVFFSDASVSGDVLIITGQAKVTNENMTLTI